MFDDWFETIYASEQEAPPNWTDMCIMQRFQTTFDEGDEPPKLADEWLTPAEIAQQKQHRHVNDLRQGRKLYHELNVKETGDDPKPTSSPNTPNPPSLPSSQSPTFTREQPTQTREPSELSNWKHHRSPEPTPVPAPVHSDANSQTNSSTARYPVRSNHNQIDRINPTWKGKSYDKPRHYLSALAAALALTNTVQAAVPTAHFLNFQALGMDPYTGISEPLHPGLLQSPFALESMAFKAKKVTKDPDLPTTREALAGPYAEDFWRAMDKEIESLESKGTWEVVDRSSVPKGVKVVPGTWSQRIKRHPDGRLNKFKSRWCFRGDLERDSYEGNPYSPLVAWPTVRASLLLAATHGWKSRQVDFTLAFCQSPQKHEVYMELPQYYRPRIVMAEMLFSS